MQQNKAADIVNTILLYVVWIILSISIVGLMLYGHNTLVSAVFLTKVNPWGLRAIDLWSMVVFGLATLIAIFFVEGFLRDGAKTHKLWKRVGIVVLVEGVIAGILAIVRLFV
jgi:hypothetical protein